MPDSSNISPPRNVHHSRWNALRPGDDVATLRRELLSVQGALIDLSSRLHRISIEDTRDREVQKSVLSAENGVEGSISYLRAAVERIGRQTSTKRAA